MRKLYQFGIISGSLVMLLSYQNCSKVGDGSTLAQIDIDSGLGNGIDSNNSGNNDAPDNTAPADNNSDTNTPPQSNPPPTTGATGVDPAVCDAYVGNAFKPVISNIDRLSSTVYVGQGNGSGSTRDSINYLTTFSGTAEYLEIARPTCEFVAEKSTSGLRRDVFNCNVTSKKFDISHSVNDPSDECPLPPNTTAKAVYRITPKTLCLTRNAMSGDPIEIEVTLISNCAEEKKQVVGDINELQKDSDQTGDQLAISGRWVATSAPGDQSHSQVRLYLRTGMSYQLHHVFNFTSDVQDVDVDGDTMVVGLPYSNSNDGQIKVFNLAPSTPVELTTQNAKGTKATGSLFGYSVGISGNVIVVGAPNTQNGVGAVHVSNLSGSTLIYVSQVTFPELGSDWSGWQQRHQHRLGSSVDIDGTTIIAGAPVDASSLATNKTGSLNVITGNTTSGFSITKSFAPGKNLFGYAVALHGQMAIISDEKTYAKIYNVVTDTQASNGQTIDLKISSTNLIYRLSVAISDQYAAIGITHDSGKNIGLYVGAVKLIELSSNKSRMVYALDRENDQSSFGSSIAIEGQHMVVGAKGDNLIGNTQDRTVGVGAGSIYSYDLSTIVEM